MTRVMTRLCSLLLSAAFLFAAVPAYAATQDFRLANQSGVDFFTLYISPSGDQSWGDDLLGEEVLLDGDSVDVSFSGHTACLWDLLLTDEEDSSVTWTGINLCQSSIVVLHCDEEECWAEYE